MLKNFFIGILVFITIAGCALQVDIASKRDEAYREKIGRILIFISLNESSADINPSMVSRSFIDRLSARGVVTETLVDKRRSSNRDDLIEILIDMRPSPNHDHSKVMLRNAIARFKPNQIMFLFTTGTRVISLRNGGTMKYFQLECRINNTDTGKRIWRALLEKHSGWEEGQKNADILVEKIIEKLDADGLLPVSDTAQKE